MENRFFNDNTISSIQSPREKIKFLLQFATLAPSTHNSQPWLFKINDNSCEIYLDPSKQLPEADKTGRDMYISLGCCIENLLIAARSYDICPSLKLILKHDFIAIVEFKNLNNKIEIKEKKMLDAIKKRVNLRGFYIHKDIPPKLINKLEFYSMDYPSVKFHPVLDEQKRMSIVDLTAEGLRIAYQNRLFRNEMSLWFNSNDSRRKEGIPGYSINLPLVISKIFPLIIKYFDVGKIVSLLNKKSMRTSPLISVLTTKTNTKKEWIEVGMLAERLMLELRAAGIFSAVYVASIEIGRLSEELQVILKTKDHVQFLFCSGYSDNPKQYVPRFTVEEKLLD